MNKLDVLILSQPSRLLFLGQIMQEIGRQTVNHPDVGVIVRCFDPELTLGENRNILRAKSSAEYVQYIDDDDALTSDYFDRIMPFLHEADGWCPPDYIGFRLQCYCTHMNWTRYGNTFHSLEYGSRPDPWAREGQNFYRDITHINPMRRELAIQADFDGGFGEDCRWAAKIRKLGIVKTQSYIPDVMYHYIWRAVKNDMADAVNPTRLALLEAIRNGTANIWPGRFVPPDRQVPSRENPHS